MIGAATGAFGGCDTTAVAWPPCIVSEPTSLAAPLSQKINPAVQKRLAELGPRLSCLKLSGLKIIPSTEWRNNANVKFHSSQTIPYVHVNVKDLKHTACGASGKPIKGHTRETKDAAYPLLGRMPDESSASVQLTSSRSEMQKPVSEPLLSTEPTRSFLHYTTLHCLCHRARPISNAAGNFLGACKTRTAI